MYPEFDSFSLKSWSKTLPSLAQVTPNNFPCFSSYSCGSVWFRPSSQSNLGTYKSDYVKTNQWFPITLRIICKALSLAKRPSIIWCLPITPISCMYSHSSFLFILLQPTLLWWSLNICPHSDPRASGFATFMSWNTFPHISTWLSLLTLDCYSNVTFLEKLFLYSLSILHPFFIFLHRTYLHVKLYIGLVTPLLKCDLCRSRDLFLCFHLFCLNLYPQHPE